MRGQYKVTHTVRIEKLESDAYPGIKRIACLQHVKRKFLEVQEEPDAQKIVELTNKLYQKNMNTVLVDRDGQTKITSGTGKGMRRRYSAK